MLGATQPAVAQQPLTVVAGRSQNGLPEAPLVLDLPEVEVPERAAILERGESPVYYRIPDDTVSAWSQTGIGVHVGLPTDHADTLARATEGARFTLDLLAGVELSFDRREPASLVVELGYSYVYEDSHWFVAGLGPALHRVGPDTEPQAPRPTGEFGVALVPHAVVGSLDGHFAYGVRSSLLMRWTGLGVELAHQVARADELDRTVHELHLMFSPTFSSADL